MIDIDHFSAVSSEVLVLGALDSDNGVVLLRTDRGAALGSRIA